MDTDYPKGKLLAIGGNEDKGTYPNPRTKRMYTLNFFELGILKRIMMEIHDSNPVIEVVTTASMIPEEVGELYLTAFRLLNCDQIGLMHIRNEEEARQPEYVERLKKANAVMFSGGDQSRLTQMFGGTEFLEVLKQRYWHEENFLIAGTSAGAMAMSNIMIKGGSVPNALRKGSVKLGPGLGLIKNVIIDSHFVKRGRFGRLIEAVSLNNNLIGIGLGEDTGVLITKGHFIETVGSNLVVIIDGSEIKHNNTIYADKGTPLSVENIELHILATGNVYDINTKEFYADFDAHEEWLKSQLPGEDDSNVPEPDSK